MRWDDAPYVLTSTSATSLQIGHVGLQQQRKLFPLKMISVAHDGHKVCLQLRKRNLLRVFSLHWEQVYMVVVA